MKVNKKKIKNIAYFIKTQDFLKACLNVGALKVAIKDFWGTTYGFNLYIEILLKNLKKRRFFIASSVLRKLQDKINTKEQELQNDC